MGHVYIEIRCLFTSKLSVCSNLTVLAPKKNVKYKEHFFCSWALASHFLVILCYLTPFSFFEFYEVRSFSLQYPPNKILVYSHILVVWNSHILIALTWTVVSFGNVGFESKLCVICSQTVHRQFRFMLCRYVSVHCLNGRNSADEVYYIYMKVCYARAHMHTCMWVQIWRNTCG